MKKRSLIFLLLPLLLVGCQSYKKVPYLQDDLQQIPWQIQASET